MSVITRFAPSPTGFLHIGGARTALFNWLFAHHSRVHGDGGKFLLRVEDTDRKRSTAEAVEAIYDGLRWLGIEWDGEAHSQFANVERHREAVDQLLASGHAYRCYCTPEELSEMRQRARAEGRKEMYDGTWRDKDTTDIPRGIAPAIRLKAPKDGETIIYDRVQGEVCVKNTEMDDMILLRGDGTPTYMLAVVVDDHDMGVSHIIRGDDHLTNAFRQTQLFHALGWKIPTFAHIPLIHGADGAKMSKRYGALGVDAYRSLGFLPEAVCNYLLRLGWSHGDDEIISQCQAIEWFNLAAVGRSPARFDVDKLTALNGQYMRNCDNARLIDLMVTEITKRQGSAISQIVLDRLVAGFPGLKERAKTIAELIDKSLFYAYNRPIKIDNNAQDIITEEARQILRSVRDGIATMNEWTEKSLEIWVREFSKRNEIKIGKIALPIRVALTGATSSPSVFEVMAVLGKEESLGRIDDTIGAN